MNEKLFNELRRVNSIEADTSSIAGQALKPLQTLSNNIVDLNAMILAITDVLTPDQLEDYYKAYERRLAQLKLKIASLVEDASENP